MFGDRTERPTVDPQVATAPWDCVRVSDPEASVGDRGVSGTQRRRLLWPSGVAFDGMFRVVLHLTGDLQGAVDDGGDHLQSEALLALCRLSSSGITRTFMRC